MNESLREMNGSEALVADAGTVGYQETERVEIGADKSEIRGFVGSAREYEHSEHTPSGRRTLSELTMERDVAKNKAINYLKISVITGYVAFIAFQAYTPAFIYATYWGLGNLLALALLLGGISGVALAAAAVYGSMYLYKKRQANK